MYTTIQDEGRWVPRYHGMPVAGPMDSEKFSLGQAPRRHVKTSYAFIECTLLPPILTAVKGTCIVVFTGADMEPTINSVRVRDIFHLYVADGDVISAVLANVVCACRIISHFLVVSTCRDQMAAYRPIHTSENWGPEGLIHYKREMNLASKHSSEIKYITGLPW